MAPYERAASPALLRPQAPGDLATANQNINQHFQHKQQQHEKTRYEKASYISRYFYIFFLPILRLSRKRAILTSDLDGPCTDNKSSKLGLNLVKSWNIELTDYANPSVARALFRVHKFEIIFYIIYEAMADLICYPLNTIAVGWVINRTAAYTHLRDFPPKELLEPATPLTAFNSTTTTNATTHVHTKLEAELAYQFSQIGVNLGIIIIMSILGCTFAQPHYFWMSRLGMRLRISVCQLIYRKALKLNQSAMMQTNVGQLINMLSGDVNRFDQAGPFLSFLIIAPVQALVITAILSIFYIGLIPALAGLIAVVVYLFLQTIIGKSFTKFRALTAKRIDERVRLMNETIPAIRIIKMYAWEKPMAWFIHQARKHEIKAIAITSILRGTSQGFFFISSKVISFVALFTYLFTSGNELTAEVVFVTIGLSNLLRVSLTLYLPTAVSTGAEAWITCQRIGKFLLLPEIELRPKNYVKTNDTQTASEAIAFTQVTASWTQTQRNSDVLDILNSTSLSQDNILKNLTFAVKPRELLLIVGRVGAGKSSVLNAMIGELPVTRGLVQINGRISYASQEAWIFSGTVRDNILFGQQYEPVRYRNVTKVCSLDKDLELLVDGDMTIVGDKGVSLSGGQKARVNLARALYREADIYLLDDPLSAVDAPVAKHIFERCLQVFLRKKVVVLVTHQLQFLRFASKVLVVGGIDSPSVFGSVEQIMKSEVFNKQLNYSKTAFEDALNKTQEEELNDTHSTLKERGALSMQRRLTQRRKTSTSSTNTLSSIESQHLLDGGPIKVEFEGSSERSGTEKLGDISANWSTYCYYFKMGTNIFGHLYIIVLVIWAHFLFQFVDYYLSLWTDSQERQREQGEQFLKKSFVDYLTGKQTAYGYGILLIVLTISGMLLAYSMYFFALRASIRIHNKLFQSIVRAPMRFFDFSPIGILLNRFANDINAIDEVIPFVLLDIFIVLGNIFSVLILSMLVYPTIIPVALLVLIVCILIHNAVAKLICKLKQIENINRSPIYSQLSTTINGIATIRVSRSQDRMLAKFTDFQDEHTRVAFYVIVSGRWMAISLKWLLIAYLICITVIIMEISFESLNASTLGLLLSQTTSIQSSFQYAMRQFVEFENQMTSVQRVKDFSFIESEDNELQIIKTNHNNGAAADASNQRLQQQIVAIDSSGKRRTDGGVEFELGQRHVRVVDGPGFASIGKVELKNVTLGYFKDEAPVLKNLSFKIAPCEKVGIVGRTGAGKSSIISVLFRLYEFDGVVEIDGIDTKSVPLDELRASMSIIPQDPILFGASVRKNLDPIGEHDDEKLWKALEIVQLKDACHSLDFEVSEAGANFSVGQRQLICLARAILRRNKILMLDEATANVDPETDSYIQKIIATEFASCTVITIAHRLITIAGADKVLVMDAGRAVEFASPAELASNKKSLFSQMIDSALDADRIRHLIKESAKAKKAAASKSQ